MTERARRAGLWLLGLAGVVALALAWRGYGDASLILMLQSLPFCG
ncbi:MAG: hypothetical protein R3D28_17240 [Geminicoccaceae bacterium]|jgi:hypothetical protein|nr:hypothetical protein [Geminicoccaceae bacterium]